jgi:hypothetical protein
MLRSALVLIHASTGVAGLVTGLGALTPPRPVDNRRWLRRLYAVSITILVTSMVVLVAVDWTALDVVGRVAFVGLIGLGSDGVSAGPGVSRSFHSERGLAGPIY